MKTTNDFTLIATKDYTVSSYDGYYTSYLLVNNDNHKLYIVNDSHIDICSGGLSITDIFDFTLGYNTVALKDDIITDVDDSDFGIDDIVISTSITSYTQKYSVYDSKSTDIFVDDKHWDILKDFWAVKKQFFDAVKS